MTATFPTTVKNFGTDHVNGDVIVPGDVNNLRAEVAAVQSLNAYQLVPSIASNNLTLAIKALSGGDPSATEPISFMIGGAGHTLTAALSVTANAGTSLFNAGASELKTKDIDFFVYIGWRAASSTLFVLFSRIPWARTYNDFSTVSTNEKYGIYSGSAPATTDVVRVIGRFAAQNSGTASFSWSIPTPFVIHEQTYETRLLDWTPSWTNVTTTNATVSAKYQISGDMKMKCYVSFTFGAATAFTGAVSFTMPMSMGASIGADPVGLAVFRDVGIAQYGGQMFWSTTNSVTPEALNASGTYLTQAAISATVPFTWGSGDLFHCDFEFFLV